MTGIELLKRMQPELRPSIKVVFYTAYNQYLLDALRASAFDFLLKPYTIDELTVIIDRYREATPKNLEQSMNQLLGQDKKIVAVQTASGLTLVNSERILLFDFSNENRCWQMTLADINNLKPQKLRQGASANDLLAMGNMMTMISKDCIVNINYLMTIENKTLKCRFCHPFDKIERTASNRYFKKIREKLEII